jgi:hypothetical protein
MLNSGPKRFAVCFSGQLRTWRKCIDTWHNILMHNGTSDNVDVFCHFWDFNSLPNSIESKTNPTTTLVPMEEIQEVIEILKPKKFLIESEKIMYPMSNTQALTHPPFLSQFYGIMRSARMKKEYEIENNLMYDAVVRARYDSFYNTQISQYYDNINPNTMHGCHYGWANHNKRGRMGDICWISDSITYDIISDYYLNLTYINKSWFNTSVVPESVFFHYLKKCNISLISNSWDIKIFRESRAYSYSKTEGGYEIW